uniref:UPF0020 domain-containing protein n=1 Tax=Parascaris univalens TaxID=6257 RepID=A0A915BEC7_PARUN
MSYTVTVARGMQPFALEQLALNSCIVRRAATEGKISFDCEDARKLLTLKCVERIFICIASESFEGATTNKKELFDILFAKCDPSLIASAFEELRNFQQFSFDSHKVDFRVSVRTSGKWKRKIDSEKLSSSIARYLKRRFMWRSVLREALFELCIHISNEDIFIGVPLSRIPLSSRPYLHRNGLRATVCDAMLSLGHIHEGHIILDLTCGSSSILMQAAHDLPQRCFLLGCDISEQSLHLSVMNRNHLEEFDKINHLVELIAADIHLDFLRLNAIDRIISDLPFGHQHANEEESLKIVKRVIDIFARCSLACEAVLLVAADHLPLVTSSLMGTSRLLTIYPLSLGNTQAAILSLVNS